MKSFNQLGKSTSIISIVFSVLMVATYQSIAAPLTPGNVLISDPFHLGQSVIEYQPDGTLVQTILVEQPTYAGDVGGITFDEQGLLWLYNGNVSPYLSSWDSESNTWTHETYPDWNSFLCFPCQGIGTFDNFVFASDWGSFGNPNGIVRFNRDNVTWVRFSEGTNYSALAVGLDGLLYARRADDVSPPPPTMIDIFDPVTLELLNTVTLSDRSLTIAADASGQIYGASNQSILHYGADGVLVDTHQVISEGYLYTLALSSDGRFVVVSSDGEVVIVGADFIPLHSFRIITGSWAYAAIIPESTTGIEIDIKPNDEENSINPRSTGSLSVAILTTENFDALEVDPMTVQFGPAGAVDTHGGAHAKDVDYDGDIDLLFHFRIPETGIQCGDTKATLTGTTWGNISIIGTDSVNTVGCRSRANTTVKKLSARK